MVIDLTEEEVKYIITLVDIMGEKDYDHGKSISDKFALLTKVKDEARSKQVHKWEGEACNGCKHSHTFHSRGVGMCAAANCDCWEFAPSGKDV